MRGSPCRLLDEVTTHLDLATIKALADALRTYEGAIILITHDRSVLPFPALLAPALTKILDPLSPLPSWFCRRVIEGATLREAAASLDDDGDLSADSSSSDDDAASALPFGKVFRVQNAKVRLMEGGMSEYVEKVDRALAKKALLAEAAGR